jgi:hypothetical protein
MFSRQPTSSALLPEKSLGPSNNTPKFSKETLQADLQFIHLHPPTATEPSEQIKLQNYINYQYVCLTQNIDEVAKDVFTLTEHSKKLHHYVETLQEDQQALKTKLDEITTQLSTIQLVISRFQIAVPKPISPLEYVCVDTKGLTFNYSYTLSSRSSNSAGL